MVGLGGFGSTVPGISDDEGLSQDQVTRDLQALEDTEVGRELDSFLRGMFPEAYANEQAREAARARRAEQYSPPAKMNSRWGGVPQLPSLVLNPYAFGFEAQEAMPRGQFSTEISSKQAAQVEDMGFPSLDDAGMPDVGLTTGTAPTSGAVASSPAGFGGFADASIGTPSGLAGVDIGQQTSAPVLSDAQVDAAAYISSNPVGMAAISGMQQGFAEPSFASIGTPSVAMGVDMDAPGMPDNADVANEATGAMGTAPTSSPGLGLVSNASVADEATGAMGTAPTSGAVASSPQAAQPYAGWNLSREIGNIRSLRAVQEMAEQAVQKAPAERAAARARAEQEAQAEKAAAAQIASFAAPMMSSVARGLGIDMGFPSLDDAGMPDVGLTTSPGLAPLGMEGVAIDDDSTVEASLMSAVDAPSIMGSLASSGIGFGAPAAMGSLDSASFGAIGTPSVTMGVDMDAPGMPDNADVAAKAAAAQIASFAAPMMGPAIESAVDSFQNASNLANAFADFADNPQAEANPQASGLTTSPGLAPLGMEGVAIDDDSTVEASLMSAVDAPSIMGSLASSGIGFGAPAAMGSLDSASFGAIGTPSVSMGADMDAPGMPDNADVANEATGSRGTAPTSSPSLGLASNASVADEATGAMGTAPTSGAVASSPAGFGGFAGASIGTPSSVPGVDIGQQTSAPALSSEQKSEAAELSANPFGMAALSNISANAAMPSFASLAEPVTTSNPISQVGIAMEPVTAPVQSSFSPIASNVRTGSLPQANQRVDAPILSKQPQLEAGYSKGEVGFGIDPIHGTITGAMSPHTMSSTPQMGQVGMAQQSAAQQGAAQQSSGFGIDPVTGEIGDVEGGGAGGAGGSPKVVCTAMNATYGFGSYRQAIWLEQAANLHPSYQRGYHALAKPMIAYAWSGDTWPRRSVRRAMELAARYRTADIRRQKSGKRFWPGAVVRAVLEPLCFVVGQFVRK